MQKKSMESVHKLAPSTKAANSSLKQIQNARPATLNLIFKTKISRTILSTIKLKTAQFKLKLILKKNFTSNMMLNRKATLK